MTEIAVRPPVDGAGRDQKTLKPWAGPERLRPVKLDAIAAHLRPRRRFALSLQLLEAKFPQQIAWLLAHTTISATTGWWVVNAELWGWLGQTSCSEAGRFLILLILRQWFPDTLDKYCNITRPFDSVPPLLDDFFALLKSWFEVNDFLWEWLQEQDWPDVADRLVTEGPPVKCLGFCEEELYGDYAPVGLLRALLGDPAEIHCYRSEYYADTISFSDRQGLMTWSEAGKLAAWARLEDVEADPYRYPERFHDLPELARWACHITGNPILDGLSCEECFGRTRRWRWSDLAEIKTAWQQARPAIEKLDRLVAWYEKDGPDCLSKITRFLMCKDDYRCRQLTLPGLLIENLA